MAGTRRVAAGEADGIQPSVAGTDARVIRHRKRHSDGRSARQDGGHERVKQVVAGTARSSALSSSHLDVASAIVSVSSASAGALACCPCIAPRRGPTAGEPRPGTPDRESTTRAVDRAIARERVQQLGTPHRADSDLVGRHAERRSTTHDCQGVQAELRAAGIGDPTILKTLSLLQGILRRAVIWRRIQSNSSRRFKKPSQRRKRMVRPIAPAGVEAIRISLLGGNRLGDAVLVSLLAYAGLRPGRGSRSAMEGCQGAHPHRRTFACAWGGEGDQDGARTRCATSRAPRGGPCGAASRLWAPARVVLGLPGPRWSALDRLALA